MSTGPHLQLIAPRMVVLGELASGGMGTVWLAHIEDAPERLVALKRMHKHLAKEGQFMNMFLDEIWLTGALRHPNVVGLVGWGIDGEGPYFATEFVQGASLGQINKNGRATGAPLPPVLVAYAASQIARGLHAANTLASEDGQPLNIVHRDLTPSNVLVGFDGSVKITDFGVAKAARKIVKTATGILKGKLHYMSPEYVRGKELDARSDLYSLGVVMYELCTGVRPFKGEGEYELLHQVATEEAPPVSLVIALDPALAAVVDRLRARQPDQRFDSGAAVADALEAWLSEQGHSLDDCRARLARYVEQHCREGHEVIAGIRDKASRDGVQVFTAAHTAASSPGRVATDSLPHGDSAPDWDSAPTIARASEPDPSVSRPLTRALASSTGEPTTDGSLAAVDASGTMLQVTAPIGMARSRLPMLIVAAVAALGGATVVAVVATTSSSDEPAGRPAPVVATATSAVVDLPEAPEARATSAAATATASASEPPDEPPAPPAAATTPTPSAGKTTPARTARPGTSAKPSPKPRPKPKRSCTPMDFDYPNCKG